METKKVKRKRLTMQSYSEEFKRKICEEYLRGGVTKVFLLKKYNIRFRSAVQKWMQQLGYKDIHQKARYLRPNITSKLANNKPFNSAPVSEQSLESRVKELERQLEDEQLRSEAFQRIIDIAEKEFNIPIRKKPSTK